MASWLTLLLVAVAAAAVVESRAIPAEPVSLMLDAYGNPVLFVREKRTPIQPYPQRAMMFTGYYRPVRRSNNGGQATGVFAQGNAVSGEAFFGGMHTPHLKDGPEPVEEQEISSAEAHAAPGQPEGPLEEEEEGGQEPSNGYVPQQNPQQHPHSQEEEQGEGVQGGEQHSQESEQPHPEQGQENEEAGKPEADVPSVAAADEAPAAAPATEATVANRPSKPNTGKKHKKIPAPVDDDDDEDDDEDENDEPSVPFVPFNKGNRRRQGYPNLNNFFPMVFSFPGVSTRAGSSGSPPGAVTAIANSYSTGKGGVASSVATAYGGSPNGKKRRVPPAEE